MNPGLVHPALDPRVRVVALLALASLGCVGDSDRRPSRTPGPPARVGVEPVAEVHLFESNSSALIAWRRADVRDRVLVHLDGHADLDWLPDETMARLAAAQPTELLNDQIHPYAMDGSDLAGFGVANFIYPAARMGIVRELVWVVPDGSLRDRTAAQRLIHGAIIREVQMVPVEEARSLRFEDGVVRGQILDLPITVCELSRLPAIDEPVLLDIDLDYFTTRSGPRSHVTGRPWTTPARVLDSLRERGVSTDLATIALSTLGGYVPPSARWMGLSLRERLRRGGPGGGLDAERQRLSELEARGEIGAAVEACRAWVERFPDDASAWFALGEFLELEGNLEQADRARLRAGQLDPLLIHGDLFIADRLRLNGGFEAALARYRRYSERLAGGPFTAYAAKRQAECLSRIHRDAESRELYVRALRLAPGNAELLMGLGLLERQRGDLEGAIGHLREARAAAPEHARFALALGTTYLIAGRVAEGIEQLEQAIGLQPCSWTARGNLSAALLRVGRLEDAARHLQVGLAFQPLNPRLQAVARQLDALGVQVAVAEAGPHAPPAPSSSLQRNVAHGD